MSSRSQGEAPLFGVGVVADKKPLPRPPVVSPTHIAASEVRPACRCRAHAFPHYHDIESRRRAAQRFNVDLQGLRRPLDVPDKDKATWPEEGW